MTDTKIQNECDGDSVRSKKQVLDIGKLYEMDTDDVEVCLDDTIYANLTYIQLSHRDVYIDFLKMPGIIQNGKQAIHGTRVYMSHSAAQQMARVLTGLLKQVHEDGGMEMYDPELHSATVDLPLKEEQ